MGAVFRSLVSGVFSVLIGLTAREAAACSGGGLVDPLLVGSPANGDVDVPTDVIPYYSLQMIHESTPSDIPLSLVSADGEEIALTVESNSVNVFEIVPHRTLEPNTEYTLSATLNTSRDGTGESKVDQITFTTGAGAFAGTPEPPDALLVHYRFQESASGSCHSDTGTCVAFQPGLPVLAEFGGATDSYLYDASYFSNLSGINQGTPYECVILRTRALDASLSEPVELCRRDGPSYLLGGSTNIACTPEGLTQDGELVTGDTAKGGSGGADGSGGTVVVAGGTAGASTMGGTGAAAGATVEEPGGQSAEPSDRAVSGCTCRVGGVSSKPSLAVVALLAASTVLRRSSRARSTRTKDRA